MRIIAMVNTELVANCNGIRTLVDAILDPSLEDVSNALTLTLLYVLDHPKTRKFIRPAIDMQRLLSPFSDTDSPIDKNEDISARHDTTQRVLFVFFFL